MRDVEEVLAALAAGVGVPPGEARWLWFCSECGACEGDTMQPGCCRSCGSSAEGVRLKARFASDALAGVGEARPAEPPQADEYDVMPMTEAVALRDEVAQLRRELRITNEQLREASGYEAECGRLQEQLDAAERRCDQAYERFDAASNDAMRAHLRVSALTGALKGVANAYGCYAGCTGALPGAPTDGSGHTPVCLAARAALGVVGPEE